MKTFMIGAVRTLGWLALAAVLIILMRSCVEYDMECYFRKYPAATKGDYWYDVFKKN